MIHRYFKLLNNLSVPGRWYLNGVRDELGNKIDSRMFRYGVRVDANIPQHLPSYEDGRLIEVCAPLRVSLRREGKSLDLTFADFDVPVVTQRVAELIEAIAGQDIQRFPVVVDTSTEAYEIINASCRLDCIDVEQSVIDRWGENDNMPDKVGKPRVISKLRIDIGRAEGHHILRPEGWVVALIVSDVVKAALENARVSGTQFVEV